MIVLPEDYKTRMKVQYLFSFETSNALYVNGDIAIILPKEINVDESALVFTPSVSVSLTNYVSLSVTYDEVSETRTIKIS